LGQGGDKGSDWQSQWLNAFSEEWDYISIYIYWSLRDLEQRGVRTQRACEMRRE